MAASLYYYTIPYPTINVAICFSSIEFNVVLCQCSTDLCCTITAKSFNDALFDVALLTVAQLNVLLF